jgi:hypothetical protein
VAAVANASFMSFPAFFADSQSFLSLVLPVAPAGAAEDGAGETGAAAGEALPGADGVDPAVRWI